ncbi:helix-turn-helix domain-containing protein, partial [Vibrio rotiferianus]
LENIETRQSYIDEPIARTHSNNTPYFNDDGSIRPMWEVEREAIQNAINFCDGNVLNAAVMLELSPSTVYRKKQAWEADEAKIE